MSKKRIVKDPEVRRQELIEAAKELLASGTVTMSELMKKLGIAKGTIYHYFASKELLLEAVVEDIVNKHVSKLSSLLEQSPQMKVLDKFKMLATSGSTTTENMRILDQLHHPDYSEIHSRQLASNLVKLAPLYASVIEEGCRQGIFKCVHPLECAELLLAGIQFLTDLGCYAWSNSDLLRRMEAFPKLCEAILQAPAGAFDFIKEA